MKLTTEIVDKAIELLTDGNNSNHFICAALFNAYREFNPNCDRESLHRSIRILMREKFFDKAQKLTPVRLWLGGISWWKNYEESPENLPEQYKAWIDVVRPIKIHILKDLREDLS